MTVLSSRRGLLCGVAALPMLSLDAVASIVPSNLAQACAFAIAHGHWLDRLSIEESWSDERVNDEFSKCTAAFDRALAEPSQSRSDLVAKARQCLDDRERFSPEDEADTGERLVFVVLREVIALCA